MNSHSTNVTSSQIRAVQELQAALDGIALNVNADWAIVSRELRDGESGAAAESLHHLGRPGLWKLITGARVPRWVFEVPLCVVDEIGAEEADEDGDVRFAGLRKLVAAAVATMDGVASPDWPAPPAQQIARVIAPDMLAVQCAEVACQGRIVRSDHRLSVEFPIVTNIPADLSASRVQKLHALLGEAHNKWRLVRVGLREDANANGARSAVAEADLTGIPPAAIDSLLRYSADASRHLVRWAGGSAAMLIDGRACELLDR
jgi:hypothetical protein